MARKSVKGYAEKNYYDVTRFSGGIIATNDPLNEGYFKHLVNFDISDMGQSITPRKGFLTTTCKDDKNNIITFNSNTIYYYDASIGKWVFMDFSDFVHTEYKSKIMYEYYNGVVEWSMRYSENDDEGLLLAGNKPNYIVDKSDNIFIKKPTNQLYVTLNESDYITYEFFFNKKNTEFSLTINYLNNSPKVRLSFDRGKSWVENYDLFTNRIFTTTEGCVRIELSAYRDPEGFVQTSDITYIAIQANDTRIGYAYPEAEIKYYPKTYLVDFNLENKYITDIVPIDTVENLVINGEDFTEYKIDRNDAQLMIDEYGNDCPYDFRNIKFKVGDKYFYTFTFVESEDLSGSVHDISCKHSSYSGSVHNNVINRYISNNMQYLNRITFISNVYKDNGEYCFGYNFFNNTFGNDCYNNTFSNNCYNNKFDIGCAYNTFGDHCQSNTFGDNCQSNTFGNECYSNTFGNNCSSNTFGNNCSSNTFGNWCGEFTFEGTTYNGNEFMEGCECNLFGNYCGENKFSKNCRNNTFGNNCYYNKFGNDCINNTFGTKCYNNIFGTVNSNNEFDSNAGSCSRNTFGTNCYNNKLFNSCNNNSFDIDCHDNEFGTSCTYNKFDTLCAAIKFGSNCSYNTLGNGCTNITFGISSTIRSYYRRIIIDSGNRYIYLNCGTSGSSKYYQNVRIGLGVNNTTTYKTINIDTVNAAHEIKVANNSNGELKVYCEADLIA